MNTFIHYHIGHPTIILKIIIKRYKDCKKKKKIVLFFFFEVVGTEHRSEYGYLNQRLANILCKMQDSNYFRLSCPYGLYYNYSYMYHGSSQAQYINKWVWLCISKALVTKRRADRIWSKELEFVTPALRSCPSLNFAYVLVELLREISKF